MRYILGWLLLFVAAPACAQTSYSACAPGSAPQPAGSNYAGGLSSSYNGLTPERLAGATSITAKEARCIIDAKPDASGGALVLAAVSDAQLIPNSLPLPWAAEPQDFPDNTQQRLQLLMQHMGVNRDQPLIVYCHHASCFMSYNVAARLVKLGYTRVFWLRTGIEDWKKEGYPLIARDDARENQADRRRIANYQIADHKCWLDAMPRYRITNYVDGLIYGGDLAKSKASWEKTVAASQKKFSDCLRANGPEPVVSSGSKDFGDLLAKGDGIVADYHAAVVKAFEDDPRAWLNNSDRRGLIKLEVLRAQVAQMATAKTLAATCGTFDTKARARDEAQLKAIADKYASFTTCARNWGTALPKTTTSNPFDRSMLRDASEWAIGAAPYRCSVRPAKNCLPDAEWDAVGKLATPANVARMREVSSSLTYDARQEELSMLDLSFSAWKLLLEACYGAKDPNASACQPK